MVVLLDIDGVLVTNPIWRAVELEADGFIKFDENAAKNLARIIDETGASIVLTTSHRVNYSVENWKVLLNARGISPYLIEKINDLSALNYLQDRGREIEEWVSQVGFDKNYVIIDDDLSINELPEGITSRFVRTMPRIGLDNMSTLQALAILRNGDEQHG